MRLVGFHLCFYLIYLSVILILIAELETDDFHKIFAIMPALMRVNLRFAGQIKDRVIEYMLDRDLKVRQLQLDAANLVSDSSWQQLFQKLGSQLESVKLSNLDYSFTDETVERMCESCVALQQLKLKQCWKLGNDSLSAITTLPAQLNLLWLIEKSKPRIYCALTHVGRLTADFDFLYDKMPPIESL